MSMIGKTVGHYRISGQIGHGGMGEVFLGDDLNLNRKVALKFLPEAFTRDPERKGRFEREARVLASLNHPNIVSIYDIGQADGSEYIVMEYVAGKTMDELIPHKGMRLPVVLKHAVQIAGALARAHGAGIIHRDLKPSNVIVDEHGQVKVLDFGLAKLAEIRASDAETATTRTGPYTILGTAAYMSPEQAEGKRMDARSDIFSFGSLLYEMLTGRRAFAGDTRASSIALILREDPKPISELVQDVPRDVERIVRRCLRKDPEQRFQTMADLKVALGELKDESDSGKLTGAAAAEGPRKWRWRPWAAAAAAVVLLVAGVLVWRPHQAAPAVELKSVRLTSYSGYASEPSFSPDGSKVVFSWNGEKKDHTNIYIKQIGSSGPPLRLTTSPVDEHTPVWSPDDRWIAFVRSGEHPGDNASILLIPPIGGPERKLTEISAIGADLGIWWTPDGKWLAFTETEPPQGASSIWAISIDTGERLRLTTFHSQSVSQSVSPLGDQRPTISPDGRTLAFERNTGVFMCELYVQRLTRDLRPDGEPRRVTDQPYWYISNIAWTAGGRDLVYVTQEGLWRVPASGKRPPTRLLFAPREVGSFAIAGSQRRLVYSAFIQDESLMRLDTRTRQSRQLFDTVYWSAFPQYSPDGKKIAYESTRSGSMEDWTCDADGTNCVQLTSFNGPLTGPAKWSPDGRWLAFTLSDNGQSEIYVMAADGGTPRRITNDPEDDWFPSWSHDGGWIYFQSSRGGSYQVWKVLKDGGQEVQVTRSGGLVAFESPDGKYLYYFKSESENSGLFRMPAAGGAEEGVVPKAYPTSWGVTAKGVYFQSDEKTIQFFDTASGRVSTLANLDKPTLWGLTASPDDAYVTWFSHGGTTSNLMLVEGFR